MLINTTPPFYYILWHLHYNARKFYITASLRNRYHLTVDTFTFFSRLHPKPNRVLEKHQQ